MEIIRPGTWLKFQGIQAFVAAAVIGPHGEVAYRLAWLSEHNLLSEACVPAEMLSEDRTEKQMMRVGFVPPPDP